MFLTHHSRNNEFMDLCIYVTTMVNENVVKMAPTIYIDAHIYFLQSNKLKIQINSRV